MTDDFHLFGDPSEGNEPIDPDIALVTAYLARELSPLQVLALEERLAADPEFRAEMQPLIDAWAAPVPSLEGGHVGRIAALSVLERAESWRRFQSETIPVALSEPIAIDVPPARTTRRISMKRVALLTAAIGLPMVSFAQVVVYAANHTELPGHAIAQRVVSAFAHKPTAPVDRRDPANRVTSDLTDGRLPRPLSATKIAPTESAKIVETPSVAPSAAVPSPGPAPKKSSLPNRALIAELTRRYQPELVRGDTSAEYVVMVLDAGDGYVWSTIGHGNLGIEVGGDSRSLRERAAFTYEYRDEFWGDSTMRPAARGRAMNGGFGIGAPGRGRARGGSVQFDSMAVIAGGGFGGRGSFPLDSTRIVAGRGARGGSISARLVRGDTIYMLQYDSISFRFSGRGGIVGSGAMSADSIGRGFGVGRGRGGFGSQASTSASGGYRASWIGNAGGAAVNRAQGLEPPSAERSGIQGLSPTFVESADMYFFAPRELTPFNLRVMVIHLTPGATWRGPS